MSRPPDFNLCTEVDRQLRRTRKDRQGPPCFLCATCGEPVGFKPTDPKCRCEKP